MSAGLVALRQEHDIRLHAWGFRARIEEHLIQGWHSLLFLWIGERSGMIDVAEVRYFNRHHGI